MRNFMILTAVTATVLGLATGTARADFPGYHRLVDGWYHRYLGRHVDPAGLHDHVRALRHDTPAYVVEAAILSSPEYWHRSGCTPEGFVIALYCDVLGASPRPGELHRWARRVAIHGRNETAQRFLLEERVTTQVVVASPPPVVVTRPPVVVAPPAPVVVTPAYRVPVYEPRPNFSFQLRVGR